MGEGEEQTDLQNGNVLGQLFQTDTSSQILTLMFQRLEAFLALDAQRSHHPLCSAADRTAQHH